MGVVIYPVSELKEYGALNVYSSMPRQRLDLFLNRKLVPQMSAPFGFIAFQWNGLEHQSKLVYEIFHFIPEVSFRVNGAKDGPNRTPSEVVKEGLENLIRFADNSGDKVVIMPDLNSEAYASKEAV